VICILAMSLMVGWNCRKSENLHCIEKIPQINDNVAVPEFVVMQNHVHMIFIIDNPIEWPDDERLPRCDSPTA